MSPAPRETGKAFSQRMTCFKTGTSNSSALGHVVDGDPADALADNHRVDGRAVVAGQNVAAFLRLIFPAEDLQLEPEVPQQIDGADCDLIKQCISSFQRGLDRQGKRGGPLNDQLFDGVDRLLEGKVGRVDQHSVVGLSQGGRCPAGVLLVAAENVLQNFLVCHLLPLLDVLQMAAFGAGLVGGGQENFSAQRRG